MDAYTRATEIVKKLVRAGYIAYFAGGWVRDYVMKHPSADIDIATNAPTDVILDLFPRTILVGLAFGVVIVAIDGHQFEVSTFRRDIGYSDGRKPDKIELASPQEDAQRRDFTVNGMFYDPLENEIYDYVNGMQDITEGVIRTIGSPDERFVEDRLRMIRAVRFAARFGFVIDPETERAIIENADTLFPPVAIERVWQELTKMTSSPRFDWALIEMHRMGLLQVMFPMLQHVHLKDIKHRVSSFAHFPKDCPTILYIIELFPDETLDQLLDLCAYLKISSHDARLVEYACKAKTLLRDEMESDRTRWVHFYAHPLSQVVLEAFAAHMTQKERDDFLERSRDRQEGLRHHIHRISKKKPLVTAQDLINLGIKPGKIMGALLKEAEQIAINYDLNDVEQVVDILKTATHWPSI